MSNDKNASYATLAEIEGAVVSAILAKKNIWPETVAKELNIKMDTLSDILNGTTTVPRTLVIPLCQLVGLSTLALISLFDSVTVELLPRKIRLLSKEDADSGNVTLINERDPYLLKDLATFVVSGERITHSPGDHINKPVTTLIDDIRLASDEARLMYLKVVDGYKLKREDIGLMNSLRSELNRKFDPNESPISHELYAVSDTAFNYATKAIELGTE